MCKQFWSTFYHCHISTMIVSGGIVTFLKISSSVPQKKGSCFIIKKCKKIRNFKANARLAMSLNRPAIFVQYKYLLLLSL